MAALDSTLSEPLLELLLQNGLYALPQALTLLLNAAMQAERQTYLGLQPYERSPERTDHANGYKPKTLSTRVGSLPFDSVDPLRGLLPDGSGARTTQ